MIRLNEWELNRPYAIIQYYDDIDYNEDKSSIAIFQTREEFIEFIKQLDELISDTGTIYRILYHKELEYI